MHIREHAKSAMMIPSLLNQIRIIRYAWMVNLIGKFYSSYVGIGQYESTSNVSFVTSIFLVPRCMLKLWAVLK